MNYLYLISFLIIIVNSCNETVNRRMELVLSNKTDRKIEVQVYPKSNFVQNEMYAFSDFGSGYNKTKFEIEANEEKVLFYSGNHKQKPYSLATDVFDSIHVKLAGDEPNPIHFLPGSCEGYNINLFNHKSAWSLEKVLHDEPDKYNKNRVSSNKYRFIISKELLTSNNTNKE